MCKIVSSMKSLGYEIVTFVCNDYLNIWTGQAVWESHFLGVFLIISRFLLSCEQEILWMIMKIHISMNHHGFLDKSLLSPPNFLSFIEIKFGENNNLLFIKKKWNIWWGRCFWCVVFCLCVWLVGIKWMHFMVMNKKFIKSYISSYE